MTPTRLAAPRPLFLVLALTLALAAAGASVAQTLDPLLLGGRHQLEAGTRHDGAVTALGAAVTIQPGARLNGSISVVGGRLVLRGRVSGPVHAYGASVRLEDGAVVDGPLTLAFSELERTPGAQVQGPVQRDAGLPVSVGRPLNWDGAWEGPWGTPGRAFDRGFGRGRVEPFVVFVQGLLLAGAAFLLARLAPHRLDGIGATLVARPGPSLLTGLVAVVVTVLAAAMLAITLIGIPAALLLALIAWLATVFGLIAASDLLGSRLWPDAHDRGASAALGGFLVAVAWAALGALPVLGGLAQAAVALTVLGAVVRSRVGEGPRAGTDATATTS